MFLLFYVVCFVVMLSYVVCCLFLWLFFVVYCLLLVLLFISTFVEFLCFMLELFFVCFLLVWFLKAAEKESRASDVDFYRVVCLRPGEVSGTKEAHKHTLKLK